MALVPPESVGRGTDRGDLSFSPDSRWVATAGEDQSMKVWEVATGREVLNLLGHVDCVSDVSYSPDGKSLVTSGYDGTLRVWDADSSHDARFRTIVQLRSPLSAVAFNPVDGGLAFAEQGGAVHVWDATSGRETEVFVLKPEAGPNLGLAFSPDGKNLAGAFGDWREEIPGHVKIWDLATRRLIHTLDGQIGACTSLAFSPDGRFIAAGGGATHRRSSIKIWNSRTGLEQWDLGGAHGHQHGGGAVVFGFGGNLVVSAASDDVVKFWDMSSGNWLRDGRASDAGRSCHIAISPDGRRIASTGKDKDLKVLETTTGEVLFTLRGHTDTSRCLVISPDGKRLASAGQDRTVKIWDMTSGQELLTLRGHTAPVHGVAFSPDGTRIASASEDGTLKIWNASPITALAPNAKLVQTQP